MFSARHQHDLSLSHWPHHFVATFSKVQSLCKTSFSARDQNVLSFSHCVHHFLAFFNKVHEFVQNSVYNIKSAPFVIFSLGAPLFSEFQQIARVCTKQRFQPKISTFVHFRTGRTTFTLFSKTHWFVQSSLFTRDKNVLSFSHLAHYF